MPAFDGTENPEEHGYTTITSSTTDSKEVVEAVAKGEEVPDRADQALEDYDEVNPADVRADDEVVTAELDADAKKKAAELAKDEDPTPRAGETPEQAAERVSRSKAARTPKGRIAQLDDDIGARTAALRSLEEQIELRKAELEKPAEPKAEAPKVEEPPVVVDPPVAEAPTLDDPNDPEPSEDDIGTKYATVNAFYAAMGAWGARQELRKQHVAAWEKAKADHASAVETANKAAIDEFNAHNKAVDEDYLKSYEAAKTAHAADFDTKLDAAVKAGLKISAVMDATIRESGVGGELFYHLISNVDVAQKIAAKRTPVAQALALSDLIHSLNLKPGESSSSATAPTRTATTREDSGSTEKDGTTQASRKPSNAPAPVSQVRGSTTTAVRSSAELAATDIDAWMREQDAIAKAAGRR